MTFEFDYTGWRDVGIGVSFYKFTDRPTLYAGVTEISLKFLAWELSFYFGGKKMTRPTYTRMKSEKG